jgi:hypothetical protein
MSEIVSEVKVDKKKLCKSCKYERQMDHFVGKAGREVKTCKTCRGYQEKYRNVNGDMIKKKMNDRYREMKKAMMEFKAQGEGGREEEKTISSV